MDPSETLRNPWLFAAWPGLGNVSLNAAVYLVDALGMEQFDRAPSGKYFEVRHVEVQSGVARTPPLPRSRFFGWRNPAGERDLVVFIGEAQPQTGGWALCRELMERAQRLDVRRVVTMAAIATQLHPSAEPAVRAAVTQPALLNELRELSIQPLERGQIGGLNGVALAAALERNIEGVCLTSEIPYFAAGVANLKASHAALQTFTEMADINVDLDPLEQQAETMTEQLLALLERLQEQSGQEGAPSPEELTEGEAFETPEEEEGEAAGEEESLLPRDRARLEQMFAEAEEDRSKAFQLKQELDRLGVFKEYEDRFLDLFRRAE
jgi:proteasome assembly chaperone (PAC2) family protein